MNTTPTPTPASSGITVRRLSSGYYHVSGDGVCNWAQPPRWPCSEEELREHAFPEAGEEFLWRACALAAGRKEAS